MKKLSLPHVLSLAVAAVCVAVPGCAETDFSGSPAEATAFPAGTAAEDDILAAADVSAPEPALAAAQPADGVYIIPDDVRCYVRKEDRVTFCTDHDGAPINGEMRKYREDELIRTYPLKDGVLNGTAVSYYISGGILAEKPYKGGKLDGVAKTYYKTGKEETVVPYTAGKREGVAKYYYQNGYMQGQGIYINGRLNGPSRLYDESGELVYELTYENDTVVSAYCMYKKNPDTGKRYRKDIDAGIVDLINRKQIAPKPVIVENKCAMERISE